MSKCIENRIVLSEAYFKKVKADLVRMKRPLRRLPCGRLADTQVGISRRAGADPVPSD